MDILALVANLQRLAVVPHTFADVARHIYVRQKMHLDFDNTIALTGFATTALNIEAETPRHVAA